MRHVDTLGAAVVAGLLHSLLTTTASFAGTWVGSAVGYACVFVVFGAVYHRLAARQPLVRTDGGPDASAPDHERRPTDS
ncbi:MAG: hypothetical protein A07HB70_01839 [uncultured archaeon A07HB70]|nr:MAG: hypothetical protein A07HB70_01839 [uncultured archaeon A07HB70]